MIPIERIGYHAVSVDERLYAIVKTQQEVNHRNMMYFIRILRQWKLIQLFLAIIIGIFMLPSFLCAQESKQTYDKDSIRYPSMNTGQVWAKIGKDGLPIPGHNSQQIMKNDSAQNGDAKALTKTQPKVSSQVYKNGVPNSEATPQKKTQSKASNQTYKKGNQNAVTSNLLQKRRGHIAKKTTSVTPKSDDNGKNRQSKTEMNDSDKQMAYNLNRGWHHKRELYDVDCAEKLARVVFTYYFDKQEKVVGSKQTNDAKWQHIYPGSFEEQLYTDICHPR
jgi:hypothetical protein